jgi:hypothetical protein
MKPENKEEYPMAKALREHLEAMNEDEREALRKEFAEEAKNSVGPTVDEYLEFLNKQKP